MPSRLSHVGFRRRNFADVRQDQGRPEETVEILRGQGRGGGCGHVVDPSIAGIANPSADDEIETGVPMDNNQNGQKQRDQTKDIRVIGLSFDFIREFERSIDTKQSIESQGRKQRQFGNEIEKVRR